MNKKVLTVIAVVMLVALLGVCLVACNATDYQKRLKDKGYVVIVSEDDSAAVLAAEASLKIDGRYEGGIEFIVSAAKAGEAVTITKFDKLKDAKTFVDTFDGNENIKRTDRWVFVGTEQGIKDAK